MQLSRATLLGAVHSEPEVTYVKGGITALRFRLSGVLEHEGHKVTWNQSIEMFDSLANLWATRLKAGMVVYLEGSLIYSEYESQATKRKRTAVRVRAFNIEVLDGLKPAKWQKGYVLTEGAINEVTLMGYVTFVKPVMSRNGLVNNVSLSVGQNNRKDFIQVTIWRSDKEVLKGHTLWVRGYIFTEYHEDPKTQETIAYVKVNATRVEHYNTKPSTVQIEIAEEVKPTPTVVDSFVASMGSNDDDDDDSISMVDLDEDGELYV